MLKVIKVKVEPLTAEAFETFGQAIETFDEASERVHRDADVSDPPPDKLSRKVGCAATLPATTTGSPSILPPCANLAS